MHSLDEQQSRSLLVGVPCFDTTAYGEACMAGKRWQSIVACWWLAGGEASGYAIGMVEEDELGKAIPCVGTLMIYLYGSVLRLLWALLNVFQCDGCILKLYRSFRAVTHLDRPGQLPPCTIRYVPASASLGPCLLARGYCRCCRNGRLLREQSRSFKPRILLAWLHPSSG